MAARSFGKWQWLAVGFFVAMPAAWAADTPANSSGDDSQPAATKPADAKPDADDKTTPNDTKGSDSAEPEKSTKSIHGGTSSAKADPADAAARRKAETEYFDLYMSLADTLDQVERNYVKPIDRRELMEAAIKGMLSKLDPYSNYISPEEISSFRTSVESQFGGVGIQIAIEAGQLKVISPLTGTPAYRAGVQSGDKIVKIEGESTKNLGLDDAVRKLKGEIGTMVTFTVQHPRTGKEETFALTRETVRVDTVLGDTRKADDSWDFMFDKDKKIGYIRITSFSRDTDADLKKALEQLKQQKVRGLVLDLRFNPGGLLTSAIAVCDMLIPEGERIVSTKGRNTPERVWDAQPGEKFDGFPIVVLVNRYSASASEIVSACLQDHHRAVIIGERTWGKGSVQNVVELEEGHSALKLTTATYTRPNGHNIHRFPDAKETDEWGVKPNDGMEVSLNNAEMGALLADRHDRDIVPAKLADQKTGNQKPEQSADAKQKTDDATSKDESNKEESDSSTIDEKSTATTESHTPASDGGEKQKLAGSKSLKLVDRQMQKGLEYLTIELAHAK